MVRPPSRSPAVRVVRQKGGASNATTVLRCGLSPSRGPEAPPAPPSVCRGRLPTCGRAAPSVIGHASQVVTIGERGQDRVSRSRNAWAVVLVVVGGLVATGCGSSGSKSASTTTTAAAPKVSGSVTVSAAASLTEAFKKIGDSFKAANPGTNVTFNFGSSGTLATQIQQSAPADTFASADQDNMNKLVSANLVDGAPTVFAKNKLVIVTKPGNPKNVTGLADLPKLGVVSLCGTTVPCGKYAGQILQTAGVTIPTSKITRGQDVKATLAAVRNGDA